MTGIVYFTGYEGKENQYDSLEEALDATLEDIKTSIGYCLQAGSKIDETYLDEIFRTYFITPYDMDLEKPIWGGFIELCDEVDQAEALILDLCDEHPEAAEQVLDYVLSDYARLGWEEKRAELLSGLAKVDVSPFGEEKYRYEIGPMADDIRLDLIIEELHDDLRKAA